MGWPSKLFWGEEGGKILNNLPSSFELKEAIKIGGCRKCRLQKMYEQVYHHQTRLVIDLNHFGMKV